jgi:hypothetical protein
MGQKKAPGLYEIRGRDGMEQVAARADLQTFNEFLQRGHSPRFPSSGVLKHAPASDLSLRCNVVPDDFSLSETLVLKATFGKVPRDLQWELIFEYLLRYCVPPAALKTVTSEALVKSLEARAVDAGLPGAFPDKLTALDNQHNLDVSVAKPIAINKALYTQTLFRNRPSAKRFKLVEPGKGMLGAAAIQSLLSPIFT